MLYTGVKRGKQCTGHEGGERKGEGLPWADAEPCRNLGPPEVYSDISECQVDVSKTKERMVGSCIQQ